MHKQNSPPTHYIYSKMQILLACAKTMATSTDIEVPAVSTPRFETEANRFALAMMNYSVSEVAQMMHCSTSIAATTRNRFANFFSDEEKLPAILAYTGQAYRGLRADTLIHLDMLFAQRHLHITSFLYGLLRPLDRIHPYRMEGNVELEPAGGINMFAFWRSRLTQRLIDAVKADDGVLMHLATEEMEHLFDWKRVAKELRVIQPLFLCEQNGQLKIVTVHAKTCRGAMTRHIIKHRLSEPDDIASFEHQGFTFCPDLSETHRPVFVKY